MKIGFDVSKTVRQRTSVRTYADAPVTQETRDKILAYAETIENPFDAKVRFCFIEKKTAENGEKLGTYGFIKGGNLFLGMAVENKEDAALAVGFVGEQLVLYMTSLGLGTCWLGGTFTKSEFEKGMKLAQNEKFPILTPVGVPAKQRITEKVFRASLKADKRLPAEQLFFTDAFTTPLDLHTVGKYADCLESLRLAPSARNIQPWRVVYDGRAFHFFKKGSWDFMQKIDLGIGINHFALTAQECGLQGQITKTDVSAYSLEKDMCYVASWVCADV